MGGEGEASSKSQFRVVDYSVAVSAAGQSTANRQSSQSEQPVLTSMRHISILRIYRL